MEHRKQGNIYTIMTVMRRLITVVFCGAAILTIWASSAEAQTADITFTDITSSAGLGGIGNCSWSCAFGDYDRDGDLDLMITGHLQQQTNSQNYFFVNNGNLTFTDATLSVGINPLTGDPHGAGWGDFDNDGDLDLLIVHGTNKDGQPGVNDNEFYRNEGNGTFVDINDLAGTTYINYRNRGANWIDLNNDGLLDIFSTGKVDVKKGGEGNLVLRNNGDGTFANISLESGVKAPTEENFMSVWADYDNDYDMDVFICPEGWLFANNGNGTFSDATAAAGIVPILECKGAAFGDYDNDGYVDLYIPTRDSVTPHILYHNNGNGTFSNVTDAVGVTATFGAGAAIWGDVDNDGDLDLYVSSIKHDTAPNRLYKNNGDGTFTDMAAGAGVGAQTVIQQGTDAAFADIDNDGFLDLLVLNGESLAHQPCEGPYVLFHNDGNGNHWLQFSLVGTQSNRDGIGVEIILQTADGVRQTRHYVGGQHYISQDLIPVHFGLGTNTQVVSVEVRWPSGTVDYLSNLSADQTVTVTEGSTSGSPLTITTAFLPFGVVGAPYSAPVEVSGGTPPYAWSLLDGNLPADLTLDPGTGVISGIPTTAGSFPLTVQVNDTNASVATAALTLTVNAALGDVTFTDLTVQAGFGGVTGCSLSAAWADYNGDGYNDVMIATHIQNGTGGLNHLFYNNGNLTFTEVTDQNGIKAFDEDPHGAGWGDFENDGDPDLFLAHGLLLGKSPQNNELYQNQGNGAFVDIAAAAGVTPQNTQQLTGVSWIDENNDGLLDLFVSGKARDKQLLGNFLYRNNGDGTFTDVAVAAGIDEYDGQTFSAAWQDYDGDGDLDVFLCGNRDPLVMVKIGNSVLFQNNGDGTYTDVTASAGIVPINSCRGGAWGDYDNDGDTDLFVTSLSSNPNTLYQNNGDGTFTDVGATAGVSEFAESDGAEWGDYDNDGDLDLLVIRGDNAAQSDRLFRNNGDGSFTDVAAASGMAGPGVAGDGADGAMVDADNDGFLDIFITNGSGSSNSCNLGPYLFYHNNRENENHRLDIRLIGQTSNRNGIGTKIWINTADGRQQYRQYFGPQHFISQDGLPVHFGLGANTDVQSVTVQWPSGLVDYLVNLPADRTVALLEGTSPNPLSITTTALPGGTVGVSYTATLAANGGTAPIGWAITAGNLPPGLVLDPASGMISGMPTTVGSFPVTIRVNDANGSSASVALTMTVSADTVTIASAIWNSTRLTLSVKASSSAAPNVTLTVVGFGDLTYDVTTNRYRGTFRDVAANPGTITVTSTGGGSATATVGSR